MSQSPTEHSTTNTSDGTPEQGYLDAWGQLAKRIQEGSSFSGRERNCCFLNLQTGQFADVSSAVGLDQIDDSRAVALVDWDHDGDLDLWLANRTGPRIRFLRNNVSHAGRSIAVHLEGDISRGSPRDAIGARVSVTVRDATGNSQTRMQTLSAGDAFLSQSSKWLVFAINADETFESLSVWWPGSKEPEVFEGVEVGYRHRLRQGMGRSNSALDSSIAAIGNREVALTPMSIEPPRMTDRARVRLSKPQMLPEISYRPWNGAPVTLKAPFDGPRLILLWASWCQPCLAELESLAKTFASPSAASLDVYALNVESLDGGEPDVDAIKSILSNIGFQGEAGFATSEFVTHLNKLNQNAVYRKRSLPLPASVLVDHGGWVRVIYKGPIEPKKLLFDLENLRTTEEQGRDLAVPFPGRWGRNIFVTNPVAVALVQREQGYQEEARDYLHKYLIENPPPPKDDESQQAATSRARLADVHHQLALVQRDLKQFGIALLELKRALAYNRDHLPALMEAAAILRAGKRLDDAYAFLIRAKELRPVDPAIHNKLGVVSMQLKRMEDAIKHFGEALKVDPNYLQSANNLSWLLATTSRESLRDGEMAVWLAEKVCKASDYKQPQALDTYAAALAETGEFEKAIATVDSAIEILEVSGTPEAIQPMLEKLISRKMLYSNGEPLRE